jgi:putative tryptophan/tyrosine transport system substrate-binding protein
MSKKIVCLALGAMLLALSLPAQAQQQVKVPGIGYLGGAFSMHPAFLQRLRDLGYVDGKNIAIEPRYAEGKLDRLPDLAAELVRLKVDIIVTQGTPAAQAAKKATNTIPIVMATGGDAVGSGLVASLARPGGNITGLSTLATDLNAKRLELLKEVVPKISRVAYLANPDIVPEMIGLKNLESVGPSLGVTVKFVAMRGPEELESAFSEAVRDKVHAAIFAQNQNYIPYRHQVVSLAAKQRLPVMYGWEDFSEAGGLMFYGVSLSDLYRRAAVYVDKILKGARPADLPVEQPAKFELVINLKAAKQIGVTIPPNVLARADRVIK